MKKTEETLKSHSNDFPPSDLHFYEDNLNQIKLDYKGCKEKNPRPRKNKKNNTQRILYTLRRRV